MVRGSPDRRIWLGLIITFGWLLLGSLYVSAAIGWVNLNRLPADELGSVTPEEQSQLFAKQSAGDPEIFSRRLLERQQANAPPEYADHTKTGTYLNV